MSIFALLPDEGARSCPYVQCPLMPICTMSLNRALQGSYDDRPRDRSWAESDAGPSGRYTDGYSNGAEWQEQERRARSSTLQQEASSRDYPQERQLARVSDSRQEADAVRQKWRPGGSWSSRDQDSSDSQDWDLYT